MKEKTKLILSISLILFGILIIILNIHNNIKSDKEIQIIPNYTIFYDQCKIMCSNYATLDIAKDSEVEVNIYLNIDKTINKINCLCSNNNISRSIKLW